MRPGGAVEEVPRLQVPLLLLDDEDALAREHEEVFLHVLRVVQPVGLAGLEDVGADCVLLEPALGREVRPFAALLAPHPAGLGEVQDVPPRARRDGALVGLFELRFLGRHAAHPNKCVMCE